MTKKTDGVLTSSVLDRAFSGAIDGQAFDSDETMILNVDQLEMNFDHSASSGELRPGERCDVYLRPPPVQKPLNGHLISTGIIGSATNEANGLDHDAVNWDRFYEFVSKMCDCSAYPGSYIPQSFTVDEVSCPLTCSLLLSFADDTSLTDLHHYPHSGRKSSQSLRKAN